MRATILLLGMSGCAVPLYASAVCGMGVPTGSAALAGTTMNAMARAALTAVMTARPRARGGKAPWFPSSSVDLEGHAYCRLFLVATRSEG